MLWKGVVCFILYLGLFFVFLGSLNATQLSSTGGFVDTNEFSKLKCQSILNTFQELPSYLFVYPGENGPNEFVHTDDRFKELCYQTKESVLGMFSLDFILQEELNNDDEWSVFSALITDEESENAIQNEIDLSEVESASDINGSKSIILKKRYVRLNDGCFDAHGSNRLQPDLLSNNFWDFSGNYIKFDFFADIKNDSCPVNSAKIAEVEIDYAVPNIPVYTNKRIEAFIRLYTVKKRKVFIRAIERLPKYEEMISKTLTEHQLPLNLAYLAVVESNLNPNARSRANAVGLWQFMSYTGKHYGLSRSWWHDDRYDPDKSTVAAAQYLKQLHRQFKGDWELALAAYNSGSGTVRRAIRKAKRNGKPTDYWSLKLPRETRGYVPAFYAVAIIFADLDKYGFKQLKPALASQAKQYLDVGGGISINQLGKLFNLESKILSNLNPRLRLRGLTPPTLGSFEVAIPVSVIVNQVHLDKLEDLKKNRHEEWKIHKVKQGENLWSISRYYRIPLSKILAYNRLKKKNVLRIGQKLMLPVPVDWNPPKRPSNTQLAVQDIHKIPGVTKIHIVQKGETLWQISQRYNISIKKIKYWNRRVLRRKYLKIGTEIVLKLPVSVASNSI